MSLRLHNTFKSMALSTSFPPIPHLRPPPPPSPRFSPPTPNSLREVCKQGNLRQAFSLLTAQAPPPPSQEHYGCVLDLIASKKATSQGMQIHAHIITTNSMRDDGFLATKVLFMYGKCGRLSDARRLFDGMPVRTIFSWNALIGAYVLFGWAGEAVRVYRAMQTLGLMPDACTFASVLKAYGAEGDGCCGSEVHGLAVKCGLDSTTLVANALVGMYAKCGWLDSAVRVFLGLRDGRDVVSWNSVISACVQNGRFSEALGLFREMQGAGIIPNSYTAVGVLQACTELSLLSLGREFHASLLKCGHGLGIFGGNALLLMYANCGRLDSALKVFRQMNEKDLVSWNSMLSGYVQNGFYCEAIKIFQEMLEDGFEDDKVCVINLSSALGRLGRLINGMEVHARAVKQGFDTDLEVGNTLMDMYTKCRLVEYSEHVFNRMGTRDYISWTTIIACYAQSSRHSEALDMFREVQKQGMKVDSMMIGSILEVCSALVCLPLLKQVHAYAIRNGLLDLVLKNKIIDIYGGCGDVEHSFRMFEGIEDKDVVTWTSMIDCCASNGMSHEALGLLVDMQKANITPDSVALVSTLRAIAGLSSLMKGKEVHGFLIRRNIPMEGILISSLVDMYAGCGSVNDAMKLFNRGKRIDDLVLWTSMVNATGMHGQGKEAIDLFERMLEIGIVPDHIAFLAVLHACSHSKLVSKGKLYLDMMTSKYGLQPWPEHYACVVDLLGRSGLMDEAYQFIKSMPVEPTAAVWCALLGACRVHRNHELGVVAADELLELEPDNPGNYALISNVFAEMGKWNDVKEVRERMAMKGLRKDPACSWIEAGNNVHVFKARDRSHKDSDAIYLKLAEITEKLRTEGGYVEDTKYVLHDVGEEEKISMLHGHSERLAIAFGLITTNSGAPLRIAKNLRVCGDCHEFTKLVSKLFEREIVVRDANRFHHFKGGSCSCGDFW